MTASGLGPAHVQGRGTLEVPREGYCSISLAAALGFCSLLQAFSVFSLTPRLTA